MCIFKVFDKHVPSREPPEIPGLATPPASDGEGRYGKRVELQIVP